MCGILGYYGNNLDRETFEKALKSISHRGPDYSATSYFENCALGHNRLSIIDLSQGGNQPMFNSDKTLCLVFNGEIYNFKEVRKQLQRKYDFISQSDSEVIIHAYEEWGTNCLQHFTGMFALVIYDRKKELLFGARDRLGEKPLKYYYKDGKFAFASEVKALLKLMPGAHELDFEAISQYLTYQYVPAPKTGFKDIFKLPPAHYFVFQKGNLQISKYWEVNYSDKLSLTEAQWQEKILTELDRVVKDRLISDVPLGAFLSGGVDSSAVVAFMSKHVKGPIKTFSMGFDDPAYDETPYARKIAQIYNTDHHVFRVERKALMDNFDTLFDFYDEPMADDSILPTFLLSKFTREHVTVCLNGDGGDESFAGYSRYNIVEMEKYFRMLPGGVRKLISGKLRNSDSKLGRRAGIFLEGLDSPFYQRYVNYNAIFTRNSKEKLLSKDFLRETSDSPNSVYKDFFNSCLSDLDNALNIDLHTYLPENLLFKTDIASMAHALELRSPLLDHNFIELFARMPSQFKLRGTDKKYLLKKTLVQNGILPKETVYRSKKGFSLPLDIWFSTDLKAYAHENVLSPILWEKGIFTEDSLRTYLNDAYRVTFTRGKEIFSIICLSRWLKTYSL